MNKEVNKKADEILGSLDGIQGAAMPAFFYTRLKARMIALETKGHEQQPKRIWVLSPVYALAALVLILLVNTAVILNTGSTTDNSTVAGDSETFQSIAAAYSLNDNNTALFEINQDK